ncbi:MAG: hypothetical protein ACREHD_04640, partial [Pirellulales bacterium]
QLMASKWCVDKRPCRQKRQYFRLSPQETTSNQKMPSAAGLCKFAKAVGSGGRLSRVLDLQAGELENGTPIHSITSVSDLCFIRGHPRHPWSEFLNRKQR